MPQETSNKYEFYFDEPRLRMTVAGRILVRVFAYVTYLVFFAAIFVFYSSRIPAFEYLAIFFTLIVIDLALHHGEGDLPISEISKKGGRVNLAKLLNPQAFAVIDRAADRSAITKKSFYLEVARRLLEYPKIEEGLRRLDIKPSEFREKIEELLAEPAPAPVSSGRAAAGPAVGSREDYLQRSEMLVRQGFSEAVGSGHNFILMSDLFSALIKINDPEMARVFDTFSIEPGDLERALMLSAVTSHRLFFDPHHVLRHRIMNRAWTSRPTPTLDRYSTDFTDLARDGDVGLMVGHKAEYERLVETLGRPTNPNALLVGEAGIGKETIVAHLALKLVKDDVPSALFDKRLVGLQLSSLVAGAAPEELNARIKTIVDEIYAAGNIILYIPDIHNLVRTSGASYLSAADALMPIIMNDAFPIVGATYPREFKQDIEARSDFAGAFEIIHVNEITEAEAEKVLTYEGVGLEREFKITISFGAIKRAVVIAKKYFHGKFLPSSAEEILKSAIVDAVHREEKNLTPDRVTAVAEEKINIPMHEAKGEEAQTLLNMEAIIHGRLVGQEEAVSAVSQALREYRSGLTRKGGPIASFLFVGPTGVGKTELAKTLAEVQFGSEKLMVRFDMTEYQDKQSFFRFIGSPDGTTHGALTDAVLEKPYCLILLDEFEKAFPDILNLFLQVLDDGRLTDNLGRTVDFTNTIIIATSNAHSDIINDALAKGESMTDIAEYLRTKLVDVFKPELLNRFSKIIIFKDLVPKDLAQIVEFNLREVSEMVKGQGIFLEFDQDAVAKIAKLGYDPAFGARPLRRVIDEKIRAPLSEAILAKKIAKGNRVKFVVAGDGFDFVPQ
jgi:ATP-dependent Clp protease ATP-binding subunit ClpC